ncbi:hypothetical protein OIV83_005022 [Microbotryomycetes sp. JL201]|nr:hypothetical protein OIV83_005022 [Microbotryomycetes sp. JL201]
MRLALGRVLAQRPASFTRNYFGTRISSQSARTMATAVTSSTPSPVELQTTADFGEFLNNHDTILFDMDGVLWRGPSGSELTPQIVECLSYLRSRGKQLAFVTNNATRSRSEYLDKMHKFGFVETTIDEIFTCGSASASYLRDVALPEIKDATKRGVYLIGQASMEQELKEVDVDWKGGTDPEDDVLLPPQDFESITHDPSIGIVLYSFDMRVNYKKLAKAFNYLNHGARLVLTNDDHSMRGTTGVVLPGEGAIAATLLSVPNVQSVVVGKPNQPLLDVVHRALQFDPARTVFVGDRLETDVMFGKRAGLSTLLVWTGQSKRHDLVGLPADQLPLYTAESVGSLLKAQA